MAGVRFLRNGLGEGKLEVGCNRDLTTSKIVDCGLWTVNSKITSGIDRLLGKRNFNFKMLKLYFNVEMKMILQRSEVK